MSDITFSRSLCIIMTAMIASLQELLKLSDEQLEKFTADFEARLSEYLQNALHKGYIVGAKPILDTCTNLLFNYPQELSLHI